MTDFWRTKVSCFFLGFRTRAHACARLRAAMLAVKQAPRAFDCDQCCVYTAAENHGKSCFPDASQQRGRCIQAVGQSVNLDSQDATVRGVFALSSFQKLVESLRPDPFFFSIVSVVYNTSDLEGGGARA